MLRNGCLLIKVWQVTSETYASPSSESGFLAFLLREPPVIPFEESFCATPRLFDDVLLVVDGPGEEEGEGGLLAVIVGLEPSSSEESPPANARRAASKSAMIR